MRYLKLSWGEPTLFLLLFSTNGSVRGNNNGVYTQAHFYGIIDMTQNLLPKRLRVIGRNNLSSLKKLSSFENYKTENKNKDVKSSVLFHESPLVPGWGRKEWIRHPFVRFFFFSRVYTEMNWNFCLNIHNCGILQKTIQSLQKVSISQSIKCAESELEQNIKVTRNKEISCQQWLLDSVLLGR